MRNWTWRGISIVLALLALPALAAIPSANKIAKAVAETNETSGRGGALLLDVQLRLNDREGPPAATGVIATHPTGLARMELKSALGFIERHLLQSDAYQASRNGELLEDDELHPFLPPVFLLQASSGEALSAALRSYGVSEFEVVLGRMNDRDCYVFGGRVVGSPEGEETLLPSLWAGRRRGVSPGSSDPLRLHPGAHLGRDHGALRAQRTPRGDPRRARHGAGGLLPARLADGSRRGASAAPGLRAQRFRAPRAAVVHHTPS
jgi:hypothetical protein